MLEARDEIVGAERTTDAFGAAQRRKHHGVGLGPDQIERLANPIEQRPDLDQGVVAAAELTRRLERYVA